MIGAMKYDGAKRLRLCSVENQRALNRGLTGFRCCCDTQFQFQNWRDGSYLKLGFRTAGSDGGIIVTGEDAWY